MTVRKGDCYFVRGRPWQYKMTSAAENDDRAVRDAALKLELRIERDPVPITASVNVELEGQKLPAGLVTAALMFAANYRYTFFRPI